MNWFKFNSDTKTDTKLLENTEYVPDAEETEEAPSTACEKRFGFSQLLTVSPSPHLKSKATTRSVMIDVLIALLPAYIWGVVIFGVRAVMIGVLSVGSAVLFEYIFQKLAGKKNTIGDFSAAVTGLLLAMNLSPAVPYWLPVVGSFFAIVVIKGLFGGLGKNIVNPALAARVFLFAWPAEMNRFPLIGNRADLFADAADIVAGATPLTQIKQTGLCDASVFDLLIGNTGGCIGEVSAMFLILGGIYLLISKVITWHIPVSILGTVAVLSAESKVTELPLC